MANVCCDDVYFFSNTNPDGIRSLWEDLEVSIILHSSPDKAAIENLFQYKNMDAKNIGLRGTVEYMEWNQDNILLCVNAAWSPLFDAYAAIAKSYEVEFVMRSIELNEDIFINTDHSGIFFTDKYILCIGDEDLITPSGTRIGDKLEFGETFASAKALIMKFEDLGYQAHSIKELAKLLEEVEIYIHEFYIP